MVWQSQPRRRGDFPDYREVPRAQGHDAQWLFVEKYSQPKPPGARAPGAELAPVLLQDEASPVLRVTGSPGGEKGPLTRVVDPSASDAREFGDLLLVRKPELQPGGLHRKAKQGPEVGEHT